MAEFAKHPIACLTLASYLPSNTGDVARKYIRDPELLSFIDIECYCWSTVLAEHTPMINAGMVSPLFAAAPLRPTLSTVARIASSGSNGQEVHFTSGVGRGILWKCRCFATGTMAASTTQLEAWAELARNWLQGCKRGAATLSTRQMCVHQPHWTLHNHT